MPDLNEFFKKEKLAKPELERIGGIKPCAKCEKDAEEYYWDPIELIMSWECPDGHNNEYRLK
jgi:hypothetical protein